MKVIHCADLHLDSKMTTNLNREQARERKLEILNTFNQLVSYAVSQKVRVILIAGDLFDTRNVSATFRNAVKDAIESHPQIDFLYLKGNHDHDNFLSNLQTIPSNLKTFQESWKSYRYGKLVITGLELSKENQASAYNSLVLSYDDYNIVTLHGQESQYAKKNQAEIIHLQELKNKNIDYLALGHVHGYKRASLDARGVYCYSGCLEGRGFDECGSKGFVVLDFDEETGKCRDRFIPFASRLHHVLEVDCTGIYSTGDALEKAKDVINNAISEQRVSEKDLVKISLVGQVEAQSELDVAYMSKALEGTFYFEKVENATKLHVDYMSYAKDESLKGEFIRMVEASELDEELKAQVIHCGLKALAGEEL